MALWISFVFKFPVNAFCPDELWCRMDCIWNKSDEDFIFRFNSQLPFELFGFTQKGTFVSKQMSKRKRLPHSSKCMECRRISEHIVPLRRLRVCCTGFSGTSVCVAPRVSVFHATLSHPVHPCKSSHRIPTTASQTPLNSLYRLDLFFLFQNENQ